MPYLYSNERENILIFLLHLTFLTSLSEDKPEVSSTTSSPYKIVEGQTAIMTCRVTTANPNTDIRWSWIKTDSPSNVLHTGSPTYTISNIQRGQSGTYSCTATNSIGMSTPATIQVDVQYGPALVMFSPDVMIINETENQTVSPVYCSAVCNPNCTYRWTGVTTVNSGRLDLGVLKRTKRGNYTCTASNIIRSSSRTIRVYVNYPPMTETFQASGNKTYEESSPFSLTCNVDSYPLSDINILNVDTGEVKASDGPIESLTYRESSAKCYHTASYTCHSKNSYGSTSSTVQRIFILCRPRPLDGQSNINIGVKTNEGLNISVKFIGYPLPKLSWMFKKNLTNDYENTAGEFQEYLVPLNVSTIQTILTKETVNQDEFGYYSVTATTPGKPYQTSNVIYHVIPERKPNPPYNISLNCKDSHGTAIVNWVPGFDGGAEQRFFVSYRTNDDDEKITSEGYKQPNAIITGLNDGTMYYFKVIANNTNGKTLSEEEEFCKTQAIPDQESNFGGIIGGTVGGVILVLLVVLLIFINRKYQIRCIERKPNASGKRADLSDNILETPGLQSEMSVQYEELKQNSRDQENSYEAITSPNKNRSSGATYEDLQPQKEENKYEEFTDPKGGKESTYTNSKMLSTANEYVNMSFK